MEHNFFEEIAALAEQSPEEEICGFLVYDGQGSAHVYPTKNVSPDNRKETWEISKEDQLQFYKTNAVVAVYHSHITCDEQPGEKDKDSSNRSELPFIIYSLKTKQFGYYRPLASIRPLTDRQFILGIQDCYQLVADYYESKLGKKLPSMLWQPDSVINGTGKWKSVAKAAGLTVHPPEEMQKDDILCISIYADQSRINHYGVYLGDNLFLHQLWSRPSSVNTLTDSWRCRVCYVLR